MVFDEQCDACHEADSCSQSSLRNVTARLCQQLLVQGFRPEHKRVGNQAICLTILTHVVPLTQRVSLASLNHMVKKQTMFNLLGAADLAADQIDYVP